MTTKGTVTPFGDRLSIAVENAGVPLAVGLDPHLNRLPEAAQATFRGLTGDAFRAAAAEAACTFSCAAIEAVADLVPAIKPQMAFYEKLGHHGYRALEQVCQYAQEAGLIFIGDGKRGDISSTAAAYAEATIAPDGPMNFDAITVNPWMGADTIEPFDALCRAHGKGVFALVRTTNPGSALLQRRGDPNMATHVAQALHTLGQGSIGASGTNAIGAVVGAQAAAEAASLRQVMPNAWFLVPGLGAQGGSPADALAGARSDGLGALPAAARSVLFGPMGTAEKGDPKQGIRNRTQKLATELARTWRQRIA